LVISHSDNTFDKKKLRDNPSPLVHLTEMKLNAFIKSAKLRDFFKDA